MKKICSFIIAFALVVIGLAFPQASRAQTVVLEPYNLVPTPPPLSKERCSYFVWNDITGKIRTDFHYYATPGKNSGEKGEENLSFDQLRVAIKDNDTPAAQKVSDPDHPELHWELTMSKATYEANQKCLPAPTATTPPVTAH